MRSDCFFQDCYPTKNSDKLLIEKFNNNYLGYHIMDNQENKRINRKIFSVWDCRSDKLAELFKIFQQQKEQFNGEHRKATAITKNFLAEDKSPGAIQKLTGLSEKEVMNLIEKH